MFFHVFLIEKSIFQLRNRFWGQKQIINFHKMLSFRYRKIDFGCLKLSRMIPGTKKQIPQKSISYKKSYITYIFIKNDNVDTISASKTYKNWLVLSCSIGQSWYHVRIPSRMAIHAKTRSKIQGSWPDPYKTHITW